MILLMSAVARAGDFCFHIETHGEIGHSHAGIFMFHWLLTLRHLVL